MIRVIASVFSVYACICMYRCVYMSIYIYMCVCVCGKRERERERGRVRESNAIGSVASGHAMGKKLATCMGRLRLCNAMWPFERPYKALWDP